MQLASHALQNQTFSTSSSRIQRLLVCISELGNSCGTLPVSCRGSRVPYGMEEYVRP
jgi:hypothetical protein